MKCKICKKEIKGRKDKSSAKNTFNYPLIITEGIFVGVLTGLVGAGGGFLIIPALVILAKLPMKMAVGTSLLIIAVKSLIGFLGDLGNPQIGQGNGIDWTFLISFRGMPLFSRQSLIACGTFSRAY